MRLGCRHKALSSHGKSIGDIANAATVAHNRGAMTKRKPIDLNGIREMHARGEKIAVLTCYDALFAGILDAAGVDILLVGDSLGNVLQGRPNTLAVSVDDMVYHTECVARGNESAWIVTDMPFGSYQESAEVAFRNAARLMQAGAHMVKLEGGDWTPAIVRFLVDRGIPVCGHLGLTPQSVHTLSGYRVQGRDEDGVQKLLRQAAELEAAGAALIVLELVPAAVGGEVTKHVSVPVIGIGAGAQCSGQVLVLHDMLGLTRSKLPRFVKNFLAGTGAVDEAVRQYVGAVKSGAFPDSTHSY